MKKITSIATALLILGVAVALFSGCSPKADAATVQKDTATAQRGNMVVNITASGNLAFSTKEDLAFEMAGTAAEVLVEEGDTVKKGQVLARLDDSAWQDTLDGLRNTVTNAQRSQTTKERALTTTQRTVESKQLALDAAQRVIAAKQLALRQEQLDLQTAEYNLSQIAQVKIAQHNVEVAEAKLTMAQAELDRAQKAREQSGVVTYSYDETDPSKTADIEALRLNVMFTQQALTNAKAERQQVIRDSKVLFSTDIATDIQNKSLAVDQAVKAVEDAQVAINDANTAVKTAQNALDDAKVAVEDAKTAIDDAKNSVADAQKNLDEALAKKTEVIAPFDGIIVSVNVAGGDEILKGRVACTIADPSKFESYVMVSEMDIGKVKQDGTASVQIDSINAAVPAKVTRIAPSATVQSGVVNYRVKVELDTSTTAAGTPQIRLPSGVTGQTGQGLDPAQMQQRLQQAVTQGRITQEQLNQFQQRAQQGGGTFQFGSGQGGQAGAATSEKPQLREGLTATINILVDSRTNVVLVPSKAITRQGGVSTVQVIKGDTTETRQVKTGLTDYQNTEITEGLSEGEQLVYSRATNTSSSSQQRQGSFFMPGPAPVIKTR